MTSHQAVGFIRRLLDDGFMRGWLEQEIGYDVVGRIRELASKGVVNEEMRPLIVYLRSVCEEVEK